MDLIYKKEKSLHRIVLIVSLLFWLAITILTFGMVLIYLAFAFIAYLFIQSGFVSHLKGTGIKVSNEQFPDIYRKFSNCCDKLDFKHLPELYIVNSQGLLNALATRFLRRKYVVLYSGVVDALKKYPEGLNFYIGHELGHIKQGHLNWNTLLWPGRLLPVIGTAYSRAREYSCDLHGLHCCNNLKEAAVAMSVLATGPESWTALNIRSYINQSKNTGSFWMSFHELTSDYPWLCKRMSHLVATHKNQKPEFPSRNIFAFVISMFVPRLGFGGGAGGLFSLFIVVAIVGVLAAVAIPQYQDYITKAKVDQAFLLGENIQQAATEYISENRVIPYDLAEIGMSNQTANEAVRLVEVTDEGFILHLTGSTLLAGKTVLYQPYLDDNENLAWNCKLGSLDYQYRPEQCR